MGVSFKVLKTPTRFHPKNSMFNSQETQVCDVRIRFQLGEKFHNFNFRSCFDFKSLWLCCCMMLLFGILIVMLIWWCLYWSLLKLQAVLFYVMGWNYIGCQNHACSLRIPLSILNDHLSLDLAIDPWWHFPSWQDGGCHQQACCCRWRHQAGFRVRWQRPQSPCRWRWFRTIVMIGDCWPQNHGEVKGRGEGEECLL